MTKQYAILVLALFTFNLLVSGKPRPQELEENLNATSNNTHKELYVIRQTVYEVGILIDANDTDDDNSSDSSESSELVDDQVQVTLFGSNHNGTVDFGDIPLPVKVNADGNAELAPVHIGEISNLTSLVDILPFNATVVNATKTESTYLILDKSNISRIDSLDDSILDHVQEISDSLPPIGDAVQ